jgi:hypothetical protein
VLEVAETGRHDEVLQTVVAHNARRRAQRKRASRNRRVARSAGRVGLVAACAVGVYLIVVLVSGLVGGGAAAPPAGAVAVGTVADTGASAAAATRGAGLVGRSAAPHVTPNPRFVRRHHSTPKAQVLAVRGAVDTGARALPVTASIASIQPRHHTAVSHNRPAAKHSVKHKAKATTSTHATVLAEADAAKGTRATALEATIPDPTVATLTISATRGSSFVEIRLKGSTGPLLNKGVVPKGETITFSNKVLWVKVYSPGRLDLSVNGKTWRPSGATVVATLSPTGIHR